MRSHVLLLVICFVSVFHQVHPSGGKDHQLDLIIWISCFLYNTTKLIIFSCKEYKSAQREQIIGQYICGRACRCQNELSPRKYQDANAFRCLFTTSTRDSVLEYDTTNFKFITPKSCFDAGFFAGCSASDLSTDVITSRSRSEISSSMERRRLLMRKIWCQVEKSYDK